MGKKITHKMILTWVFNYIFLNSLLKIYTHLEKQLKKNKIQVKTKKVD